MSEKDPDVRMVDVAEGSENPNLVPMVFLDDWELMHPNYDGLLSPIWEGYTDVEKSLGVFYIDVSAEKYRIIASASAHLAHFNRAGSFLSRDEDYRSRGGDSF